MRRGRVPGATLNDVPVRWSPLPEESWTFEESVARLMSDEQVARHVVQIATMFNQRRENLRKPFDTRVTEDLYLWDLVRLLIGPKPEPTEDEAWEAHRAKLAPYPAVDDAYDSASRERGRLYEVAWRAGWRQGRA